jgi:type I restriction enzyme S subunit
MVPKGWHKSQISEVCKLQNGNSFKPHDWGTKGLPIIRIQNLNGSNKFNYFSGTPQDRWLVETGELLFSWAGTRGVSFGPFVWKGSKGVLNQHIYKVFANNDISKKWLFLVLKFITSKIEDKAHGFKATLLHVQKKDIDNQPILCPPLSEQCKIADILETWDKAISTTEHLIDNSKQQKKALMQQLLTGKKRLLDSSGKPYEGEWKEATFSDVSTVRQGLQIAISDRLKIKTDTSLEYITIQSIKNETQQREYVESPTARVVCSANDVLMTRTGNTGIVVSNVEGVFHNNFFLIDYDKTKLDRKFLIEYLRSQPLQHTLLVKAGASTIPDLNHKDFYSIKVMLPTLNEQQKVATVLTIANKETELLKQQLAHFKQEKKALMQQLLTGKRRVKIDEKEVA